MKFVDKINMFSMEHFILLVIILFETSGIELIKLGTRIKNEWLKKTCVYFKKSYQKLS